jgi:Protein of unknown function (DUF1552)
MIVMKKAISRRTMLRGLGTTLALPLLDSMVPAFTALAKTAGKPVPRLGVVYLPNGMNMKGWTPASEGSAYALTPTLKPLEPFRDRVVILSGLDNDRVHGGDHTGAAAKFLTAMPPKQRIGEVEAGISMDQILAQHVGADTQLRSLEMSLEGYETAGTCSGNGYSCVYVTTIAYRDATTPLPMERNPRAVFERLFGDSETTDPRVRLERSRNDRSILDSVVGKVSDLSRGLGPTDRAKLTQYTEAVRDVERRIQLVEQQGAKELPLTDQPTGVPASFQEHVRLMFDLQVLAYQSDITRVVTFMLGREFSGRAYPEIGMPEAHHPTSHHQNDSEKLEKLLRLNLYQMTQFAYFLGKLAATPDGDGSMLDHVQLIYGAGMSDGNSHLHKDLPIVLAGGGAGLKTGRHVRSLHTPMANLHMTLLDRLGAHVDKLGDSTGSVDGL